MNEAALQDATLPEIHSALFQELVASHAHAALCLLGKLPDPATGDWLNPDLESAKRWIDQLEMLEVKTRGNLSPIEAQQLARALSAVHGAFEQCLEVVTRAEPA